MPCRVAQVRGDGSGGRPDLAAEGSLVGEMGPGQEGIDARSCDATTGARSGGSFVVRMAGIAGELVFGGSRSGYGRRMKRTFAGAVIGFVAIPSLAGCVVATSSGDGGNGGGFLLLFLPILLFVVVAVMARVSGRRRRASSDRPPAAEPSEHMLRAELSVLADDVLRLEPQVTLREEARDDFEAAIHRYRVAQVALDEADAPVDLVRVQRVVDEASWSMARARAVLDGRRPPAPPPRLQHAGSRGEPAIELDEREHPVYVGSEASFRAGWFGAGGGMFGGLLMGTMLGGFGGWLEDESHDRLESDSDPDGGSTEW